MNSETENNFIKTEVCKAKDLPKEAMGSMMTFGPLNGQMTELKGDLSDYLLPAETISFLECKSGESNYRKFIFEFPVEGPEYVLFCNPSNAKVLWFAIEVLDEEMAERFNNYNDPNMEKDGVYTGRAINLIHRAHGAWPEGLLLWIPELQVFGFYNLEKFELKIFPEATWNDIEQNFGLFVFSQWNNYEDAIKAESVYSHFNPWEIWEYEDNDE